MRKLTEAQIRILNDMHDVKMKFPGRGQDLTYSRLEGMGLAESSLMLAKRDNTKGITEFKLAYRRTQRGREWLKLQQKGER